LSTPTGSAVLAQFDQCCIVSDHMATTADTSASFIAHDAQASPKVAYKYILVEMKDKKTNDRKLIVRGSETAKYHSEIFDTFQGKLLPYHQQMLLVLILMCLCIVNEVRSCLNEHHQDPAQLDVICLGGGRIVVNFQEQIIYIFSYS
jgi:hypothetical protein